MGKGVKVHGRPLQSAYRRLQEIPGAPSQPKVLKELQLALKKEGFLYHPRTIKRQLLGDIEYVPQAVEQLFLDFINRDYPKFFAQLKAVYQKESDGLAASSQDDLYVSPALFLQMADVYLLRHKNLSRRQLALNLKTALQEKNTQLGLETLQAALSGKTQKIRKVVEDRLADFFLQEGLKSRDEIEALVAQSLPDEVKKIDVGDIAEQVDAFLLQMEGLSKRQLSLLLKDKLAKKGYDYHLSSIQSILEGSTRKTRKVILDTLHEIFQSHGLGELPDLSPAQLHWNHYVDAHAIVETVQKILAAHPHLSRRQIARLLQEDLKARHFHFSLNTLQFILAGKTKRAKQIVPELLGTYLDEAGSARLQAVRNFQVLPRRGSVALEQRIQQAYDRLQTTQGSERDSHFREFLAFREDLIRMRWEKRHPPARKKSNHRGGSWENYNESDEEAAYPNEYSASGEAPSFNLNRDFNRLVS